MHWKPVSINILGFEITPHNSCDAQWFQSQVKWFTDGAEFNTNHEMLIWLWSSNLADASTSKHPFAALPLRWFPTKSLRKKANQVIVDCIAWDCILKYSTLFLHL